MNLSVVSDVALAADDGLIGDLHEKGSHSDGVIVEGRDVVDHLHCVQQPHQRTLHLVRGLQQGLKNRFWHFPEIHLQIDPVAVLLCGSKVLGIVASLHMVVSNLHVNLVPDLKQGTFVRYQLNPVTTLSSLQFAALSVTRVILQG